MLFFHSLSKKKRKVLIDHPVCGSLRERGRMDGGEERSSRFGVGYEDLRVDGKLAASIPRVTDSSQEHPQFVKTTLRCRLQDGKFVRDKRNKRNASLFFFLSLLLFFFFKFLFVSPPVIPLNRRMRLEGFNWRFPRFIGEFSRSTNSLGARKFAFIGSSDVRRTFAFDRAPGFSKIRDESRKKRKSGD